jgi:hypothetical protein
METNHEIVPSSELPGLENALVTLDTLERDLAPIEARAKEMKVETADEYANAADLIAQLKISQKTGAATLAPFEGILSRVKDFLQTRKQRHKNRAESIHGILTAKMGDYTRREINAAHAEQWRINEEARRKRDAELKAAVKAGEMGKREAAKLAKEPVPEIKVKATIPKVAGVVRRTNYYAECTNEDGFLMEFAKRIVKGDKSLRHYVVVDAQQINAAAGEMKDSKALEALLPFVKAREESSFGGKA